MWQSREGRWILGTMAVLAVLLSGFVVLLWKIGLFDLPKDDPGAKAFAAVLALLGGLVAAVLTFVGVLLKLAFDARTLELQQEAESRQKEGEWRQRVDTFIRAVGLIGPSSGKETSESQKAGALFALANLGQIEFALALLRPMWSNREVSPSTAVWLINKGLQDPEENLQRQAASLLVDNTQRLIRPSEDCMEWPDCVELEWMPMLDVYARESLLETLLRGLQYAPRTEWSMRGLIWFIVQLYLIMSSDDNPSIQAGAILALDVLLPLVPAEVETILRWEQPLNVDELRRRVAASVEDARDQAALIYHELIHKLETWAKPVPAPV